MRKTVGIVAAVVVVLGAGVVTAVATLQDDGLERAEAIVSATFTGECVTSDDAVAGVGGDLEADGLSNWKVLTRADPSDCVAAGLDPSTETVILVPVDHPNVTNALHGAADELLNRCMNVERASAFVSSVLEGVGVSQFQISTDGPVAIPRDSADEVGQHMEAGCVVYSGSGRDEAGNPVYYLAANNGP